MFLRRRSQVIDGADDPPRMIEYRSTRCRDAQAAPIALEDRDTEFAFEFRDLRRA